MGEKIANQDLMAELQPYISVNQDLGTEALARHSFQRVTVGCQLISAIYRMMQSVPESLPYS